MTRTGPSSIELHAIDAFITDAVDAQWQKVAMIIARALTDAQLKLADVEDAADHVAQRLPTLSVAVGLRLRAMSPTGDIARCALRRIRRTHAEASALGIASCSALLQVSKSS